MILLRWKDNFVDFSKAGFVDFLGFVVEAMSAYQSAGDRLGEADDSVTWFRFSSLCKKDFSIFLVFLNVQGELRNSNGVKTKMLKALQMSWPNHSMFGSSNFGNCSTVAVMACLSAYLYVAQQTWHISQHLELLTAGFCIGLPGTSEDQKGGLLRGIPGGVKLFVMPIQTHFCTKTYEIIRYKFEMPPKYLRSAGLRVPFNRIFMASYSEYFSEVSIAFDPEASLGSQRAASHLPAIGRS